MHSSLKLYELQVPDPFLDSKLISSTITLSLVVDTVT
jgi:hypothetical protein